jgi:hypothetical protein
MRMLTCNLAAGCSLVALGGSFLPRFVGLVHAHLRRFAQSPECSGVLPGAGLVVCNLHGLASAVAA